MKEKQEKMKEKWGGGENTAVEFTSDEKCMHHSGCGCKDY